MTVISGADITPTLVYPDSHALGWAEGLDFAGVLLTSWPLAILLLAILFMKQVRDLIDGITLVKWGGAEATIERKLRDANEAAAEIEPAPATIAEKNKSRLLQLLNMAETSPSGAIVEAWKDIEAASRALVEESGVPMLSIPKRPYFNLQTFIAEHDLLPVAEIRTFRELRLIRNRAAHVRDDEVTAASAQDYVRLADRLVDAINAARRGPD